MSNSLRPHGLQDARPPCPSPTPGVYSLMSIESVVPSNHRPLLLPPSIFLLLNHAQPSATPWTAACQDSLCFTISWSLFIESIESIESTNACPFESVMPSNHLVLCHPLLLLPSIFPSITVFSNESALCIRWPKYWSFLLTKY